MPERMTWEQVVLISLRNGYKMSLQEIYAGIDALEGGYINPKIA